MLTVLKLFGLILVFRCKPIKFIKKIDFWKINTITNFNNIKTSYKENSKNILESSPNKRSKNSGKIKVSQNEAYLSNYQYIEW